MLKAGVVSCHYDLVFAQIWIEGVEDHTIPLEDLSCSAAACGQQSNLALGRGAGGGSRQEEQARCVQAEHKRAHHDEERARRGDEHADHGLDKERARREPQIARVAPLSCSEPPER